MKDETLKMKEPQTQLERLEREIHTELGTLGVGAKPLLNEVRAGVSALFPEPGGTRLAPKEQEAQHEKLLQSLDGLEEVLEALQLAARSGRPPTSAPRGEG